MTRVNIARRPTAAARDTPRGRARVIGPSATCILTNRDGRAVALAISSRENSPARPPVRPPPTVFLCFRPLRPPTVPNNPFCARPRKRSAADPRRNRLGSRIDTDDRRRKRLYRSSRRCRTRPSTNRLQSTTPVCHRLILYGRRCGYDNIHPSPKNCLFFRGKFMRKIGDDPVHRRRYVLQSRIYRENSANPCPSAEFVLVFSLYSLYPPVLFAIFSTR